MAISREKIRPRRAFLGSLATLGAKSATLAVTNVLSLRGPLSPPQGVYTGGPGLGGCILHIYRT